MSPITSLEVHLTAIEGSNYNFCYVHTMAIPIHTLWYSIIYYNYSTHTSTLNEHGDMEYGYREVETSSNAAYGVVSASEGCEYAEIELPLRDSHHMSSTGHSH